MGDRGFPTFGNVGGIPFVKYCRKLSKHPAIRRREGDVTAGSGQNQSYTALLHVIEQVPNAPAFAMQASQIVGNKGDYIRVAQAGLECQPSRTVLLVHAGTMAFSVLIPFRFPTVYFTNRLDMGTLALWAYLIAFVACPRLTDIAQSHVTLHFG